MRSENNRIGLKIDLSIKKRSKMVKLENKIHNKLSKEGKVSYLTIEESERIYVGATKRMQEYNREYIKKQHASYIEARKRILTSLAA